MGAFLTIDGARGEGGGQILRTSLALSAITGTPVHIEHIRARRKKPGLMRQHLSAVLAARDICRAEVSGAALHSSELWFSPGRVRGGEYHFSIGTAGSASLVFQTVLPALLCAAEPARVVFEGGTHNPMAPPVDFIARSFVPQLERMGARVRVELVQHGFFPAGGGRFVAEIAPWTERSALELTDAGRLVERRARALIAQLGRHIAERELRVIREQLGWDERECRVEVIERSSGPGNVLFCELEREHVTQVVCAFGERGVRAEAVAERAARDVRALVDSGVPVCQHLADQLMLPMALGPGGRYLTLPLSRHALTNLEVIRQFLDVVIEVAPHGENAEVSITHPRSGFG